MLRSKHCGVERDNAVQFDVEVLEQVRHSNRHKVILHNDNINDAYHVVQVLEIVFGFDKHRAEEVMFTAHITGLALCVTEHFERAELHCEQMRAGGLTTTMEPE